MSDDQFQVDDSTSSQRPGDFLRGARQSQGLTIAEVAGVTKFSPRQIEALENDDYSQLQGLTFQRGFVRAYARMLKLDPAPLLATLDAEMQPQQELVPPENMGETNPKPFYRKHFKALAVLIVVVVGALAAFSFTKSPYFKAISPAAQTSTTPAATEVTAVAVEPVHVSATVAEPVATIDLSATAAPVVTDSLSSTQALPLPAPVPVVAVPVLRFEFSDLSWLEVKDGNDQILLTGEFAGGVVKTVTKGKPPFQIWVGKASVVKVSYQGQPVDTQPHTREDVARLTLGR